MPSKFVPVEFRSAIVAVVLVLASVVPLQVRAQAVSLDPAKMPHIGTEDQRFASYNIEMAEVTVRQKAGGVGKGMSLSSNLNRHLQYTSQPVS
jgi:hypothetical protein